MIRVYVAGPYTHGDVAANVHRAIEVGNNLSLLGYTPLVPHLSHLWHLIFPRTYEFWLEYDLQWLAVCDCLLRIPGKSTGADKEVKFAIARGIPVYYSIDELELEETSE